ncbi:hypothetical protein [Paenibacillus sp. YAF4_2]|uniref:hypothetical protein n=1 Tax=Paenibacillus sp. YAF4_2 TaxID=3233085 RepID=UPI003F976CAC
MLGALKKNPVWVTLLLLIIVAAYTVISTTSISEKGYVNRALNEVDYNKHILNSQNGEVSVTSLDGKRIKELFVPKPTTFAKINRIALWINGNKAVRVLLHTDNEGLQGPITVYFNPMTKQVIGYDVLE